ncbi:hypothetical protein ABE65_004470 [Fictibacillus phosphorivorans]|uniref:Aminoglycoside phosphotransferase domain-containing protein n=1 Tax=Fictibacillus phosphorivorans TaxID=1221500 RepID=A0A160IJ78_9BACL|nr:hypothetical protein [Fictibacillus phosphorivorans]ANC76103.1 hypothetical protein ABE65_004470 [Fictibacillus phosphorivorans]
MKETFDLIDYALQQSGLEELKDPTQVQYLGEGAWHLAYLVQLRTGNAVVVRFPKTEAYGKNVEFDEAALHAEYAGTKAYYELANQVKPGICPNFFNYHVEKDRTFTVESYAGKAIKLDQLTVVEAFHIGAELGEFFRKMNAADHGLTGFGYLSWNGKHIEGKLQYDASESMKEENKEYIDDFKKFIDTYEESISPAAMIELQKCLEDRKIMDQTVVLTNQDTSPENVLLHSDGTVCLIDPVPILYSGDSLAGNFLNNYRTLFPTFFNAPRYARHEFDRYEDRLKRIADGFLEGYSHGDLAVKRRVKQEEFIQLTDLTVTHWHLLQTDELSHEQKIRYGEREAIANRITVLVKKIEEFQWFDEKSGTKLA